MRQRFSAYCNSCARATEYDTDLEDSTFDRDEDGRLVLVVGSNDTISCGHCSRVHKTPVRMRIAPDGRLDDRAAVYEALDEERALLRRVAGAAFHMRRAIGTVAFERLAGDSGLVDALDALSDLDGERSLTAGFSVPYGSTTESGS